MIPAGLKQDRERGWVPVISVCDCLGSTAGRSETTKSKPNRSAGENAEHHQPDSGNRKKSQASRLVDLVHAQNVELFHDRNRRAYASLAIGGHRETWAIRSTEFKDFVSREFYLAERASPNTQAIKDAIGTLAGEARYEGPLRDVHVRVAELDGKIYVDLGDEEWTAVEISPEGWKLVKDPPVYFRRARGMRSLPTPIHSGWLKDELHPFLNVAGENDLQLVCSYMVTAFSRGPYIILCFIGEHGSSKSTATMVVRRPIDPFEAELRTAPRNEHDLYITAYNSHVVALDNIGHLPKWLSDAMCRLSTGGGMAVRELYEDCEEIIFDAQRPQVMNSIKEVATRPDFLDRAITIILPAIDDTRRQDRETFLADYEKALPRILGAILTAISGALRDLPSTKLERLPRMADFCRFSVAAEPHMGFTPGSLLKAYAENRGRAHDAVLEEFPISPYLFEFAEKHPDGWEGTSTELLQALNELATEPARKAFGRDWPTTPRGLSGDLRELVPTLRKEGLSIVFLQRVNQGRLIRLSKVAKRPSPPSQPSQTAPGAGSSHDGGHDGREPSAEDRHADGHGASDRKHSPRDGHDGHDGVDATSESADPSSEGPQSAPDDPDFFSGEF